VPAPRRRPLIQRVCLRPSWAPHPQPPNPQPPPLLHLAPGRRTPAQPVAGRVGLQPPQRGARARARPVRPRHDRSARPCCGLRAAPSAAAAAAGRPGGRRRCRRRRRRGGCRSAGPGCATSVGALLAAAQPRSPAPAPRPRLRLGRRHPGRRRWRWLWRRRCICAPGLLRGADLAPRGLRSRQRCCWSSCGGCCRVKGPCGRRAARGAAPCTFCHLAKTDGPMLESLGCPHTVRGAFGFELNYMVSWFMLPLPGPQRASLVAVPLAAGPNGREGGIL
jgi:hypothetical protein